MYAEAGRRKGALGVTMKDLEAKMSTFTTIQELQVKLEEGSIEIEVVPEEVYLKLSPAELCYMIQEYQKHFKIVVAVGDLPWRGVIGIKSSNPDLGITNPNHWFIKDKVEGE